MVDACNLSMGVQGHPGICNNYEISYIILCLKQTNKNVKEVGSGGAGLYSPLFGMLRQEDYKFSKKKKKRYLKIKSQKELGMQLSPSFNSQY